MGLIKREGGLDSEEGGLMEGSGEVGSALLEGGCCCLRTCMEVPFV